jgi:hypothetical protein
MRQFVTARRTSIRELLHAEVAQHVERLAAYWAEALGGDLLQKGSRASGWVIP